MRFMNVLISMKKLLKIYLSVFLTHTRQRDTTHHHEVCSQGIHQISIMVYLFGYRWEVNERMSNWLFVTLQCLVWRWWWW